MKKLTRKDFLRVCGTGVSIFALQSVTAGTAFADSGGSVYDVEDVIAEINSWYFENNIPFTLESISLDSNKGIVVEPDEMMEMLRSVKVETKCDGVTETDFNEQGPENNVQRAPMPVNFNRTFGHQLQVFFDEGTAGLVHIDEWSLGQLSSNIMIFGVRVGMQSREVA